MQRARAAQSGLSPQGEALEAVAEICSALDGLPLSIELAAAQARMWPPRAILNRLQQRLGFLTDGARDLSDRQQSLRATLEWSEALLEEPDRQHFAQLGVFAGSFDLAAARPPRPTPVSDFGCWSRSEADDANVNAALSWVCASDADEPSSVAEGLRLPSAVARLRHRRSTVSDGRTYLSALLDAASRLGTVPAAVRAAALLRSAMLAVSSGEYQRATVLATECLKLFEALGDLSGMSWSRRYLAEAALAADDLPRAHASAEAQLDLASRAGDRVAEADAHNMLGQTNGRLGNFDEAEAELLQSEAAFREQGNLDGRRVFWTAWPSWPSAAGTSPWQPAGGRRRSNWTGGAETAEE